MAIIHLPPNASLDGSWAGLFISRGAGRHPTRVIDSHELIVVRSGTLCLQENGTEYRVGSGQSLLLVKGLSHGGISDYSRDLSFYWLHFTCASLRQSATAGAGRLSFPQHAQPRRPALLTEWMHRYFDDQANGFSTPVTARLLVHMILAELATAPVDAGQNNPAESAPAVHLVGRAEAWIGHHYQEQISTSDVAKALGRNADYLGRAFRQCVGHSIVESIHRRRIANARRSLIETTTAVSLIAKQVGFNDVVHFNRCFRRHVGCTPGAFRGLHARTHVNSD